jgi:hypothetical protein
MDQRRSHALIRARTFDYFAAENPQLRRHRIRAGPDNCPHRRYYCQQILCRCSNHGFAIGEWLHQLVSHAGRVETQAFSSRQQDTCELAHVSCAFSSVSFAFPLVIVGISHRDFGWNSTVG